MEKPKDDDLIAWMPKTADEEGQQMLAMWISKTMKLTKTMATNMWLWTIQQHLNQQEDKEEALQFLENRLEDHGLKMLFLDVQKMETAVTSLMDPAWNPRVHELLEAWSLDELVPNEIVTETNPEAEEILLNHDWDTMVSSIRFP
jgi:hypothetical protein